MQQEMTDSNNAALSVYCNNLKPVLYIFYVVTILNCKKERAHFEEIIHTTPIVKQYLKILASNP